MDIIGLSGRKGSGKDTVGAYLAAEWGYTSVSFAGPLKRSAAAVFDIDPALFEVMKNDDDYRVILTGKDERGFAKDFGNITVRQYLQRFGTEAHRDVFGYDFWRKALLDSLEPDGRYVITDARFEDELTALRALGGSIWRVQRDTAEVVVDTHASEEDPPDELIDVYLSNNGSFEELYRAADNLINEGSTS